MALTDHLYGPRLAAGLSYSTVIASMDFETYSEAGYVWRESVKPARMFRECPKCETTYPVARSLCVACGHENLPEIVGRWGALPHAPQGKKGIKAVGTAVYAKHPTTEVLCLQYNLKEGRGKRLWTPGMPPPIDLFLHIVRGGLIECHKVDFERWIWDEICVKRMGWPPIPETAWRCSMAKCRAHNLPGSLEDAGRVLGTIVQKDPRGPQLIARFCVPRNPTKGDPRRRIRPEEDPQGPDLYEYCGRDIDTQDAISALVPDLDPDELAWWQVDQRINRRGIAIDVGMVAACTRIVEDGLARYDAELREVTGGAVEAASQVQRLTAWLHTQDVHLDSLDEDHVEAALAPWRAAPPPPHMRAAARALEIRATVGSAAVKKLFAMGNQVTADGRLHDLFNYHGARTGRCTGNGPQPTNLPSSGPDVARCGCGRHFGRSKPACPWCGSDLIRESPVEWSHAVVEDALEVLATGSLGVVEIFFDAAFPVIAGCLRGMFTAGPGKDLVCSDYSAIEAVVLAELAGEEWRREVFRTHGKIYEAAAAKGTGIPLQEILDYPKTHGGKHHHTRKAFKVQELALGYGGFVGSMIAFGAAEFMSEDEMKDAAIQWRKDSPAVVEFWGGQSRRGPGGVMVPERYGMEGAAINATENPDVPCVVRGLTWLRRGDVLYLILLSGRPIAYHRPRLAPSRRKPWESDYQYARRSHELTLSFEGWNSNPKNGPMGWQRMETHGAKLVENGDQATSRDIQRTALVAQDRAGYAIVQHVYDENCAEVPEGWGSVEEFERIQATMAPWCADWPVRAAGGWRGKRYRK